MIKIDNEDIKVKGTNRVIANEFSLFVFFLVKALGKRAVLDMVQVGFDVYDEFHRPFS